MEARFWLLTLAPLLALLCYAALLVLVFSRARRYRLYRFFGLYLFGKPFVGLGRGRRFLIGPLHEPGMGTVRALHVAPRRRNECRVDLVLRPAIRANQPHLATRCLLPLSGPSSNRSPLSQRWFSERYTPSVQREPPVGVAAEPRLVTVKS